MRAEYATTTGREAQRRLRASWRGTRWVWLGVLIGAAYGCVGNLGDPEGVEGPNPGAERGIGPMPMLRLSRVEYKNTVRDLLGVDVINVDDLPEDSTSGSSFARGGTVSTVDARRYLDVAEQIGQALLPEIPALLACATGEPEEQCEDRFIQDLARRAYRRQPTLDEVAHLTGVYEAARAELQYDMVDATRLVLQTMLSAPAFLYHWELGPQAPQATSGIVELSPDELAARMSFYFWRSMPDDFLFAAADAGELRTTEQIDAQARRMLADPRAKDMIADFHLQWLHVNELAAGSKDPVLFPNATPELFTDMQSELVEFSDHVIREGGEGSFGELFSAPYTFANERLAQIYGVSGVSGTSLQRADLDPSQRAGILTQLAFLARNASLSASHPVKRGNVVISNVLCMTLGAPPANLPQPKPSEPGLSTRERFAEHSSSPCATGCHSVLDPAGFAFENYDAIGGYRTEDSGVPVDATGTLDTWTDEKFTFQNGVELAKQIAGSDVAKRCLTRQWYRFALGRNEVENDTVAIDAAYDELTSSGDDLQEMIIAIAKTEGFRFRTLDDNEVSQ